MKVKIPHIILHIEKQISALERQVVKDQAEDLHLKQEYKNKFFLNFLAGNIVVLGIIGLSHLKIHLSEKSLN